MYAYFNKNQDRRPSLLRGVHPEERLVIEAYLAEKDAKKRGDMASIPKEAWIVEIRGYTYHKSGEDFITDTIIENLKYPDGLKDSSGKDILKAGDEMAKLIKERVGFLHIYKIQKVELNPIPGEFDVIGKSYLKDLQKGIPFVVARAGEPDQWAPPMPGPAGPGGVGQPAADVRTRDDWRPIGEVAPDLFAGNAAQGGAGPGCRRKASSDGKDVVVVPQVPRIEFVVVFVWNEPIAAAQTINVVEKK